MTHSVDALIVGAGPVGLTMAAECRRHGLRCRIIDKSPVASDKSKALVVWTRTLELLDNMGLVEKFIDNGLLLDGATIYGDGEPKIHLVMDVAHTRFPRPVMIPQCRTEGLLTEHLLAHDIQVERSTELVRFEQNDEGVTAVLKGADGSEEIVTAAWLLGCDGAHSTVRHQLGLEFTGCAEQNDWMLADVHITGPLSSNEVSIFWHAEGILAFFPFAPGHFRMIADLGTAKGVGRPPDPTLAEVQRMIDSRGPQGLKVHDPIWLAGFRINERKVSDYRIGRVFLAGDAAHIHSPAGGQGMNTGMQDAVNLAWKLALVQRGDGKATPLLDSYSQERSEVGDMVLRNATAATKLATLRNPISQFVRNHTASFLGSFSFFRQRATSALTELAVNYPHSPLNGEHRGLTQLAWLTHGVKPGDRLPDAILTGGTHGELEHLANILHGTGHQLLLLSGTTDQAGIEKLVEIARLARRQYGEILKTQLIVPASTLHNDQKNLALAFDGVWLDAQHTVHSQHAVHEPTLVLVRPDGYVGFRSQPASWESLLSHLVKQFVPRAS